MNAPVNFDNMSDADFLKMEETASFEAPIDAPASQALTLEAQLDAAPEPVVSDAGEAHGSGAPAEGEEEEGVDAAASVAPEAGDADSDVDDLDDDAIAAQTTDKAATPAPAAAVDQKDHTTPHQTTDEDAAKAAASATPKADDAPQDFEALYKQVMAPFKANGKEFTPSSPDEAVRLMQMGANYTKKMQTLQPNLKLMRMLENNGLLDESKLGFLIDLDRKDPKAISKLLQDGKIDPLDLDTSSGETYTPGNHSVSDSEMAFHTAIDEVSQTPTGKDTINHVHSTWDNDSKQAIFREPALLSAINSQRANGIYDTICAEIDRQKTLGELQGVPFIQAYRIVGDHLQSTGRLAPAGGSQTETPAAVTQQRPVLETRVAVPRKTTVTNGEKARALSAAPKAGKPAAKPSFDPFSMSDEEIMSLSSLKV